MPFLRQSTSQVIRFGPCLDKTDGVTEETALTLAQADMRLSKDGGAFGQKSAAGNATHDSDGWYSTTLSTTDTETVGELILNVHQPANMLPVWMRWWVLEEAVYDDLFGASAAGIPTVAEIQSGLATSAALTTAQNDLDTITGTAGVIIDDSAANDTTISDAVWDETLTGGNHNAANSAGRRLRTLQESAGVYGGYIWIDTVNGADPASPTNYEDGTSDNPVNNMADANALASSLGITRFKVAPGSSITFAAAQQNQLFEGDSWTLALGSQNIDGTTIVGATVSGVGTNTSDAQYFIRCIMNACTLPGDTHTINSAIAATQTVGETGNYFWSNCYSAVAGNGTPTLDINSVANVNVNWRHYSGGVQVANAVATTAMSYESDGQIIVAASCTSLALTVRGNCSITDSGTTTSLTQDGAVNRTNINAEADTAISDAFTFTVAGQVDSNIQYVNDVLVNGTGALGDEWGP